LGDTSASLVLTCLGVVSQGFATLVDLPVAWWFMGLKSGPFLSIVFNVLVLIINLSGFSTAAPFLFS
jgi:hypothetical protein